MQLFKKIMIAVDDSADSKKAFAAAIALAKANQAELTIVTIFEINRLNVYEYLTPEVIAKHKAQVIQIAEDYRQQAEKAGIKKVATLVDEGSPAAVILKDVLPKISPDLLVCGSKGKPHHSPLILGSQAGLLAKDAPCSVIIIR